MSLMKNFLDFYWGIIEKNDEKRIASQTPIDGIDQISDIPYIDDGMREHLLDIYYPENTNEKLPVIIDIHGGGWMYGYKEINKNFCLKLAQKGFCVTSINYRLAGDYRFDDQIRDIFDAFRWISKNLSEYPADLNNVFLAGDSAGGHFVSVCAAVNNSRKMQKEFGIEPSGLDFKAVSAICPVVDLTVPHNIVMNVNIPLLLGKDYKQNKFYKYMNYREIASSDLPPFHILTASGDILKKQGHLLADILKTNGVDCIIHEYADKIDGKPPMHVFNVVNPYSIPGEKANVEITDFFKSYITQSVSAI